MPVRFRNIFTVVAPGLLAAATVGIALTASGKAEANAALAVIYQSNVPIITVPPVTTPPVGVPGTTESPVPVDPEPGPPDEETAPAAMAQQKGKEGGEKLYVYIVLQKDYKKDAKIAKHTPGVIGKNWKSVTKMQKEGFHFKLTSSAAGNEYYVVGVRKVKGKLEYQSKHPVRIERQ